MFQNRKNIIVGLLVMAVGLFLGSYNSYAETASKGVKKMEEKTERPEVGSVGKGYSGPEGLKLWVLRVGPEKNKEVLLKYFGIDHPWSGKVFKAKFEAHGETGQNYILDLDGSEYTTLVARTLWSGSELHYEAYLKGGPEGVKVSYSEAISKEIIPQHFLTEFLNQKKN